MNFILPLLIFTQHLVVLGKTGKGKSSVLRYMVEYLLRNKKRVCIVDPKGDWWGLKYSADGKSEGFPVVLFGSFKEAKATDAPINPQSGRAVAELIAKGNRPCVIGFRGWTHADMLRFWIDFAQGLFSLNAGELYFVGDEFHNFAPKGKVLSPDAGKSLHWSNRLLSEGRGIGLNCLIASQRPQKVHNDTLTSCETLVAMGVIHSADRQAVKDWVDGCGEEGKGKEVLDSLAGLQRGEAWVWSPEIKFGPKRILFPMFETFDSFAPPQLQSKFKKPDWADVNLDDVKEKFAVVIAEAKANDPTELKQRIRELEKQLKAVPAPVVGKTEIKEVPVLKGDQLSTLKAAADFLLASADKVTKAVSDIRDTCRSADIFNPATNVCAPPRLGMRPPIARLAFPQRVTPENSNSGPLPDGERAILSACIQFPEGLERNQLTVLTTYKRSTRDAYIARLRGKGFLDQSGELIVATQEGIAALPDARPLPTGAELQDHWRGKLSEGERAIFEVLLASNPAAVDRDELSNLTGYKRSTRDAYLARMVAKQIVEPEGPGRVRAAKGLFE